MEKFVEDDDKEEEDHDEGEKVDDDADDLERRAAFGRRSRHQFLYFSSIIKKKN